MDVVRLSSCDYHHQQHGGSVAARAAVVSDESRRIKRFRFVNVVVVSPDLTLPIRAVRSLSSLVSTFVALFPLWTLYESGYVVSKRGLDYGYSLLVRAKSATRFASAAAVKLYNEVNDPQVRRKLAQNLSHWLQGALGVDNVSSERQIRSFLNSQGQTVFAQSWVPVGGQDLRGLVIVLHGLNEHSGRYVHFARELNSRGYGVFGMDWIGHGGSDGLHGYVDSLDQVVEDTHLYIKQTTAEYPDVPIFVFGHSTGGAIVLKTCLMKNIKDVVKGVVLTSPAVKVKPAHPILAVLAPMFSLIMPRYQFKRATRTGVPVSRDPKALVVKYSDPLVSTGPMRIRTGTEILRLGVFLRKNLEKITTPFLVLHGSQDRVTDPEGSRELYSRAASLHKDIRIYEGLLHDLLFEIEKDEVIGEILNWLDSRLTDEC